MNKIMSELVNLRKELERLKKIESDDIRNAREFLKKYKELRLALGKPIRILSPEQIKADLTNQEFINLIKEIEGCQKSTLLR